MRAPAGWLGAIPGSLGCFVVDVDEAGTHLRHAVGYISLVVGHADTPPESSIRHDSPPRHWEETASLFGVYRNTA